METNVVDCGEREICVCKGEPSLGVLKEVQRLYEERLALVERVGGANKLQNQVEVLRSWVSDLVGQNTLLARAVEDLEAEATSALLLERMRHAERENKKKISNNQTELNILNDKLQKENVAKDREIRRLNKDAQQNEQTIINLRNEISTNSQYNQNVSKKDAEVMAGMCCTGNECGDWEPVREAGAPRDHQLEGQRLLDMEAGLKASSSSLKALRKMNVELCDEVAALRRVCGVLHEQARAAAMRTQFKDDIIREMRRQLHRAKDKLKEMSETRSTAVNVYGSGGDFPHAPGSYDSVTIACVRQQPRRARPAPPPDHARTRSGDACMHSDDACMRSDDACMHSDDACMRSDDACMHSDDACMRSDDASVRSIDVRSRSDDACMRSDDARSRSDDACSRSDLTSPRLHGSGDDILAKRVDSA